jgi:hypothetical protein
MGREFLRQNQRGPFRCRRQQVVGFVDTLGDRPRFLSELLPALSRLRVDSRAGVMPNICGESGTAAFARATLITK